jgi:hypothetical protein
MGCDYNGYNKNAFIKANIIDEFRQLIEQQNREQNELDIMFLDLLKELESIAEGFTFQELNDFVHVDDENFSEYAKAIMEEVNEVLARDAAECIKDAEAEDGNSDEEQEITDAECIDFISLDNLYDKLLKIEDQLLCGAFKEKVGNSYHAIMTSFTALQSKVRAHALEEKHI